MAAGRKVPACNAEVKTVLNILYLASTGVLKAWSSSKYTNVTMIIKIAN
jgi:hypothetical protein